jgi:hypothetical protein
MRFLQSSLADGTAPSMTFACRGRCHWEPDGGGGRSSSCSDLLAGIRLPKPRAVHDQYIEVTQAPRHNN